MWVLDEDGLTGVNLSRFDTIYVDSKDCVVASRIECDEDYREVSNHLKKFDSEDDAKKYIADLVKKLNIEQEKKFVTYGDIFKSTYGEKNFLKKSQSDGVSIADAPLVVVVQTDKDADFWR